MRWRLLLLFLAACGGSNDDDANIADTRDAQDTELNLFRGLEWRFTGDVPKGMAIYSSVGSGGGVFKNTASDDKTFFGSMDLTVSGSHWALDGKWKTTQVALVIGAAGLSRELGWVTLETPFYETPEWMDAKAEIPLDGDVVKLVVQKKGANYTFAAPPGTTAAQAPHHFQENGAVYITYRLPKKSMKVRIQIELAPDVAAEIAAAAAQGKMPVGPDPGGE